MKLSQYSIEELTQEIERRRANRIDGRKPIIPCDLCEHFVAWKKYADCPESYNPCALGKKMSFRMPEDYQAIDWGFYKRGCRDRIIRNSPP